MYDYDVIIVGSGPSGSMAAYHLAVKGISVLLLEKATLPRPKTCGGGLTFKAIKKIPFDISPVVEVFARGGIVAYEGQPLVKIEESDVAYLIRREAFDHFLAKKAVSAGARLFDNCPLSSFELDAEKVKVVTPQGTFSSRFLIGADGANSIIARKCGLLNNREMGMALEAEFEVPEDILKAQGPFSTFDFGAIPHGYGWIFPKDGRISIGVYHASPGKRSNIRQDFEHYLSMNPQIAALGIKNLHAHPIPLGGQKTPRQSGRALLVGDAANLADPWVGEGLYYAVSSAEIAADVIGKCLQENRSNLDEYDLRIYETFIKQFGYARIFARLIYRFPHFATRLISKSPTMQRMVFGNLRGTYTFERFTRNLLLNVPRIVIEALF